MRPHVNALFMFVYADYVYDTFLKHIVIYLYCFYKYYLDLLKHFVYVYVALFFTEIYLFSVFSNSYVFVLI